MTEQLASARAGDLLVPELVYGYFPANSDGTDLIIWEDETRAAERTRFAFPRQPEDLRDHPTAVELFERVRFDADLVVLSACRTAFGEERAGEGLLSLSRAFQVAVPQR